VQTPAGRSERSGVALHLEATGTQTPYAFCKLRARTSTGSETRRTSPVRGEGLRSICPERLSRHPPPPGASGPPIALCAYMTTHHAFDPRRNVGFPVATHSAVPFERVGGLRTGDVSSPRPIARDAERRDPGAASYASTRTHLAGTPASATVVLLSLTMLVVLGGAAFLGAHALVHADDPTALWRAPATPEPHPEPLAPIVAQTAIAARAPAQTISVAQVAAEPSTPLPGASSGVSPGKAAPPRSPGTFAKLESRGAQKRSETVAPELAAWPNL
jgi:hypothetical protein